MSSLENEYITKSAAIAAIGHHQCDYLNNCYEQDCLAIAHLPAADVTPVRYGEWIACGDGENVPYLCSHCGKTVSVILIEKYSHNYCPNCGARMDGNKND